MSTTAWILLGLGLVGGLVALLVYRARQAPAPAAAGAAFFPVG